MTGRRLPQVWAGIRAGLDGHRSQLRQVGCSAYPRGDRVWHARCITDFSALSPLATVSVGVPLVVQVTRMPRYPEDRRAPFYKTTASERRRPCRRKSADMPGPLPPPEKATTT